MEKSKCPKCGDEFTPFGFFVKDKTYCYSCKSKSEFRAMMITIGILFVLIVGIRVAWAKLVYDDLRCAFGECRIQFIPNQ